MLAESNITITVEYTSPSSIHHSERSCNNNNKGKTKIFYKWSAIHTCCFGKLNLLFLQLMIDSYSGEKSKIFHFMRKVLEG